MFFKKKKNIYRKCRDKAKCFDKAFTTWYLNDNKSKTFVELDIGF